MCNLSPVPSCLESPHGVVRFQEALRWLVSQERSEPLLLVAHSLDAARDLLRAATVQMHATFGWSLESLTSLSVRWSALALAERELSVATPLALEAVCVRVVSELNAQGQLGRLGHLADRPGLPRALLRTFSDIALADVDLTRLAERSPELAVGFERYEQTLSALRLADRALVLREAIAAVRNRTVPSEPRAVCLYDLEPRTKLERELVEALASTAARSFLTRASGARASEASEAVATEASSLEPGPALSMLQAQLFTASEVAGIQDGSVSILSAPGESRECVEIARRVLEEAERGVPFDRMAILLRSPFHYRTHLIEALRRASIPAHFTRGATRPEPGGRALLVLLRCAAEGLSAVRFSEYLSLGVAPATGKDGIGTSINELLVTSDEATATLLRAQSILLEDDKEPIAQPPAEHPVPRRWEKLLIDAAVIGKAERWERRLAGLECELLAQLDEADDAKSESAQRDLSALKSLSAFALPLVKRLAGLPTAASWREWLSALRDLAEQAIEHPEPALGILSELEIVGDVGPVSLMEVRAVLEGRLGEVQPAPPAARGGEILVSSVDEARGRVFDTVFVPGLAEKLFPQRVVEDPLLPDRLRSGISPSLETQVERVQSERQALRIAVGSARNRLILSYPRFESDKARPRVPSFYALEAIRAAEGTLPGFAALARRADLESRTRMGWPAPETADAAIDDSEYDLAILKEFLTGEKSQLEGAARYLVTEHRTLGRVLQARARRWRTEWRNVDGFVEPTEEARAALNARYAALKARGFSVTALERYAACPYRFFLSTVIGLRPRQTVKQVEELDLATRGLLFHEIVHRASTELSQRHLLSADSDELSAKRLVDHVVQEVAASWQDKLAPAIERIWRDAIEDLRVDVHYWLQELRQGDWQPVEFELAFGLGRTEADAEREPAVVLDSGLALRGRIDAVEQRHGELRATDYKTGEAPKYKHAIIAGGTQLQPALYALVLEKLFPSSQVTGGNAYYCTTRGAFERRPVELNDLARRAAVEFNVAVDGAFSGGFFPAAPAPGACETCDFRANCGPHERERVAQKDKSRLEGLETLRSIR